MGILLFVDRELTASQIIALAKPLGMTPTNVKSSLTRMVAEGSLARRGKARLRTYEPSDAQRPRVQELRLRLKPLDPDWDGSWIAVAGYLPAERAAKERLMASLWLDGFRMMGGTFLRPAWPTPWAIERANSYACLMEGFTVRGVLEARPNLSDHFTLSELDAEGVKLADSLDEAQEPSSPVEAFVMLMELSGRVVQLLAHDPRFPPDLVPTAGLERLRESFQALEGRLRPIALEFVGGILSPFPHKSKASLA